MTQLTTERLSPQKVGSSGPLHARLCIPVKGSTKIFAGSLVAVQAGYARPATGAAGLWVVGKAETTVDNGSGSDGDLFVEVLVGAFRFESGSGGDAIAQANLGQMAYAIDDQTVGLTSSSGTRSAAGIILEVSSQGVYVLTGIDNPELLATALVREFTFEKVAADGAAATATAETVMARASQAGSLVAAYFTPSAALTASDTDNATILIKKRDGAGGAAAAVASITTNLAQGSLVAFTPVSLGTLTNGDFAAGNLFTLTITKGGSGVAVPSGQFVLVYRPSLSGFSLCLPGEFARVTAFFPLSAPCLRPIPQAGGPRFACFLCLLTSLGLT